MLASSASTWTRGQGPEGDTHMGRAPGLSVFWVAGGPVCLTRKRQGGTAKSRLLWGPGVPGSAPGVYLAAKEAEPWLPLCRVSSHSWSGSEPGGGSQSPQNQFSFGVARCPRSGERLVGTIKAYICLCLSQSNIGISMSRSMDLIAAFYDGILLKIPVC